jgi:hypothetical protein
MSVVEDLIQYITEQKTTKDSIERIKTFCEQQQPISIVIYRGHKRSTKIRYNNFWYSATSNKKVAKEEFSSGHCCVFTIHLINVPVIDINKYVGDKIGNYKEEEEYIFLGGGTFYKDETLKEKGFLDKDNGEFECWYKIDQSRSQFSLDRILEIIPEEEYELIDSPSDIFADGLTEDEKILIFNKIQEIKKLNQNGGKIKSKRNLKRQSKRNLKRQSKHKKNKLIGVKL